MAVSIFFFYKFYQSTVNPSLVQYRRPIEVYSNHQRSDSQNIFLILVIDFKTVLKMSNIIRNILKTLH